MTHEEFVTLETAKLLKQAGFDWECYTFYDEEDDPKTRRKFRYPQNANSIAFVSYVSAPTQSVAMRWLREVKGLNINLECLYDYTNERIIYSSIITNLQNNDYRKHVLDYKDTYEQAAEEAIQECLKVILNEKEQ